MIFANYIIKSGDSKKVSELFEILTMVTRRVRYNPGCIQSELWKNEERNAYMVSEIWKTKTDFNRYVNSMIFKHFLAAMEMGSEKPQIHISECKDFRGIDLIEEVMQPTGNVV
jgi:quinol monooxygenase YgiN